ncbi:hypothetical protein LTR85_008003 [Meristemomyces frigidus]|nr:hypothetical protein LTR85_008003 [Meristemomyces frigidus]
MSTRAFIDISDWPADKPIYQPGPDSVRFAETRLGTSESLPMPPTLAVLLTDVFTALHGKLKLDGIVYCTLAGEEPIGRHWESGPQLFWVPCVRSAEQIAHWRAASLGRKLHLVSSYWKEFDRQHPVLPISLPGPDWAGASERAGAKSDSSGWVQNRKTRFPPKPTQDQLDSVSGVAVDLFFHRFLCVPLEEYMRLCTSSGQTSTTTLSQILLRQVRRVTPKAKWLESQLFEKGADQAKALVESIIDYAISHPEAMVSYGEARSWAPAASDVPSNRKYDKPLQKTRNVLARAATGSGGTVVRSTTTSAVRRTAAKAKGGAGTKKAGGAGTKKAGQSGVGARKTGGAGTKKASGVGTKDKGRPAGRKRVAWDSDEDEDDIDELSDFYEEDQAELSSLDEEGAKEDDAEAGSEDSFRP